MAELGTLEERQVHRWPWLSVSLPSGVTWTTPVPVASIPSSRPSAERARSPSAPRKPANSTASPGAAARAVERDEDAPDLRGLGLGRGDAQEPGARDGDVGSAELEEKIARRDTIADRAHPKRFDLDPAREADAERDGRESQVTSARVASRSSTRTRRIPSG